MDHIGWIINVILGILTIYAYYHKVGKIKAEAERIRRGENRQDAQQLFDEFHQILDRLQKNLEQQEKEIELYRKEIFHQKDLIDRLREEINRLHVELIEKDKLNFKLSIKLEEYHRKLKGAEQKDEGGQNQPDQPGGSGN